MPHDKNGKILAPGDEVIMRFTVVDVQASEDYCNTSLRSIETMPPYKSPDGHAQLTVNTRQVEKVETHPAEAEAVAESTAT